MGLSLHEQDVFYTKYWNEIEKNTDYDVSSFVRDYLSIRQKTIPNLKNVYPSFKSFRQEAERDGQTTEDMNPSLYYGHTFSDFLDGRSKYGPARTLANIQDSISALC